MSNLTFISKLIERAVALRLTGHLIDNNLHEVLHSAYRQHHSTETALLKVQNDLLISLDTDGGAFLVLLDLSAAFDTIDHKILLQRLYDLGVRGDALEWFRSYLTGRKQSVMIKGTRSNERDLIYGVLQGSVLGPILFTIYTIPLGDIARRYGLCYHLYADDKQLYIYISFKQADGHSVVLSVEKIQQCYLDIKAWMTQNLLKLNDDKTELLLLMRRNLRNVSPVSHIDLNMVPVHPSTTIRNLGAMFDHHMDMKSFVNMKCKATMHSLRNISCVRRSLKTEACKTLVQAYVTSKLDYCNSLLYGIPDSLVHKLKRVQHYAARVITMTRKYDHIKPVLSRLHWLPIEQRIQFKLLLYVYKALHGLAPAYLSDMLVPYQPCRPLRSSEK